MTSEEPFVKFVRRSGKKQTFKVAHGGYFYSRDNMKNDIHYYYCDYKGCKASIVSRNGTWTYGRKYWNEDGVTHVAHMPDPDRKQREAAIDRLHELTLSADGCRSAVDIVHQVLKELPLDILPQMPGVTALVARCRRFARKKNIKLLKSSPEHFFEQLQLTSAAASCSSNEVIKTGVAYTNPDEIPPEDSKSSAGLIFLHEHENEHCIAKLEGYEFTWKHTINRGEQKFLYGCRHAKDKCPVSVVINSFNGTYEMRGTHANHLGGGSSGEYRRQKSSKWKVLKRLDEDGNEIGAASLDDFLAGTAANWQGNEDDGDTCTGEKMQDSNPSTAAAVYNLGDEIGDDYCNDNDEMGNQDDDFQDDGGDFQIDNEDNNEDEQLKTGLLFKPRKQSKMSSSSYHVITTSSVPPINKLQRKSANKKARKSGERCFVCGDELIFSETISSTSSSETFKKACCYLNVKSSLEWFPPPNSCSKFYSFCESCTEEITKIHGLYRKVEEMQSLIFKKVESVEKRIADAEIVDNWMAEAPKTTAVRFEGFRKQVMINYRNKLKLRREIRFGNKIGQPLLEAIPQVSAHMFASDPATERNPNNNDDGTQISLEPPTAFSLPQKTRGRPKSKQKLASLPSAEPVVPADSPPMDFDSPNNTTDDGDDFQNDFDDFSHADAMSEASDKEVKFWETDPSKLNIPGDNKKKRRKTKDDEDTGSDPEDDEDENWDAEKQKLKTHRGPRAAAKKGRGRHREDTKLVEGGGSRKSGAEGSPIFKKGGGKNEESKEKDSSLDTSKEVEGGKGDGKAIPKKRAPRQPRKDVFPECVLTADGRVFMKGIEIIKNPPGTYKPRPLAPSFSCGTCAKICTGFWRVRMHICGHHLGMFKCPICQKECPDQRAIRDHIVSVHEPSKMEDCPICGKPIKVGRNKAHMGFHRWMHLNEEEQQDPQYSKWQPPNKRITGPPASRALQTFMCGQCARTFTNPAFLKRHEMLQHSSDPSILMCQYCGTICSGRRTLIRHVSSCANKADGLKPPEKNRYPCPKCPKAFTFRTGRSKHMKRFHGGGAGGEVSTPKDLPFACPKCTRRFSNRGGFRSHKKVCVDGEKGFGYENRQTKTTSSSSQPKPSTSGCQGGGHHHQYSSAGFKEDTNEGSSSSSSQMMRTRQNQSYGLSTLSAGVGVAASALGFNYNFLGGNYGRNH